MIDFSSPRFTRRFFDSLIAISFLAAVIASTQTLISGKIEYDTLIVRGFNLMEFSSLGCVPILAPAILLFTIFGTQDETVKELSIIISLVLVAVCYCHSFITAREWLMGISEARVTYHPCAILFPLALLLIGTTWLIKRVCLCRYGNITIIAVLVPWHKDW